MEGNLEEVVAAIKKSKHLLKTTQKPHKPD